MSSQVAVGLLGDTPSPKYKNSRILSLDQNGDIKNIFGHEPLMKEFFYTCDYFSEVLTIDEYNLYVFNKLMAIYLHNM